MRRNITMKNIIFNAIQLIQKKRKDEILQKEIKKNKRNRRSSHKNSLNIIDDLMIQEAKKTPLSEYMGNDTKIICPFHNDSAPSLSINHSAGVWHCFGCGKSGDIITFVMERESLSFKEAVLMLAGQEQKSHVSSIPPKKATKSNTVPDLSTSDLAIIDYLNNNPNKTTQEISTGTEISIPALRLYLMELINDDYLIQSDAKDAEYITFSISTKET